MSASPHSGRYGSLGSRSNQHLEPPLVCEERHTFQQSRQAGSCRPGVSWPRFPGMRAGPCFRRLRVNCRLLSGAPPGTGFRCRGQLRIGSRVRLNSCESAQDFIEVVQSGIRDHAVTFFRGDQFDVSALEDEVIGERSSHLNRALKALLEPAPLIRISIAVLAWAGGIKDDGQAPFVLSNVVAD